MVITTGALADFIEQYGEAWHAVMRKHLVRNLRNRKPFSIAAMAVLARKALP